MSEELTFGEWLEHRADRLVELGLSAPDDLRVDYMRVQARSLARDAVRFARAGLADDDPMPGILRGLTDPAFRQRSSQ